ncbi:hypothetical protein PUNSTDRAFT_133140 [Punctularia strigosozonata HHB-11173 SS5]|uniref:uncharacterized protein n=1 Tax=Punctularia strigosozonata (strain HHB-11173) TaxID=741275 RepID=UPI0004416F94|nr:uncharacterized protein PUNSTDRAFT_133140 [Punctularia strigosozonata HHB-11173 SS5]EIN11089.1 hypothetical protein PUNSTDRAFT_133140 [Punctularia strigosozonata HHB-11173 SS5]
MSAAVTPPPLDNTLGVALIGVIAASALYGLSCLQTWTYYRMYTKDPVFIRVTVAVLWILDTLHSAFISHCVYFYLVTCFGKYEDLERAIWSIIVPVALNCISAFIVQIFLSWRVYKSGCLDHFGSGCVLSQTVSDRNIVLVAVIWVLALTQLAVGLTMTGLGFQFRLFADLHNYKGVVTSSLASAALADIAIGASMCFYLYRKRTGFSSLVAVAGFISFLAMPNNLVNFAINFVLGKVYSNTILSTLNARQNLRKSNDIPLELSTTRIAAINATPLEVTAGSTTKADYDRQRMEKPLGSSASSYA